MTDVQAAEFVFMRMGGDTEGEGAEKQGNGT
jgi:hypothetical protein